MSARFDLGDLPPELRRLMEQADRWRDELERWITPVRQAQLRLAEQAAKHYETVIKPALEQAARVQAWVRDSWLRATPENWHELEDEQLDVIDLVEESGICLMWAPRPEVIRALLAADPGERYAVLLRFAPEVLDDLDAVIVEARGVEVDGHRAGCEFAAEAVAAARNGHFHAAQALSACGLGQIVHAVLGFKRLGEAFKQFQSTDVGEAALTVVKVALLEVCTARALRNYGEAEHDGFNRHGTQHGDREFFSTGDSIAAMLLLVGWLRELRWVADNEPEMLDREGDVP